MDRFTVPISSAEDGTGHGDARTRLDFCAHLLPTSTIGWLVQLARVHTDRRRGFHLKRTERFHKETRLCSPSLHVSSSPLSSRPTAPLISSLRAVPSLEFSYQGPRQKSSKHTHDDFTSCIFVCCWGACCASLVSRRVHKVRALRVTVGKCDTTQGRLLLRKRHSDRQGAREARERAPAVYMASLCATVALCCRFWPTYEELDLGGGLRWAEIRASPLGTTPARRTSLHHHLSGRSLPKSSRNVQHFAGL